MILENTKQQKQDSA